MPLQPVDPVNNSLNRRKALLGQAMHSANSNISHVKEELLEAVVYANDEQIGHIQRAINVISDLQTDISNHFKQSLAAYQEAKDRHSYDLD